jgi:DNA-binding transcriptional LysR family regulator
MARYRKIDPRIWNDERFRAFTDDGKLAFLFVLTHPSMTAVGAMRGTVAGLAAELGWTTERTRDAISVAIAEGMLDADPAACFIAARNFLRYNEPEGPNSVAKAWVEALDLIPECDGKRRVIARCRAYLDSKSKAFRDHLPDAIWDAFPDAIGDASPIQEQEQEQEQEPSNSRRAGPKKGSTLGPLSAEVVAAVSAGLGWALRPLRDQDEVAELEERIGRFGGGAEEAIQFFAATCRKRHSHPEAVKVLLLMLRDLDPKAARRAAGGS